jgi:hypothetical protein
LTKNERKILLDICYNLSFEGKLICSITTVSLTFHSALRKLNTEPPIGASHQVLVIWLNSYKEEDIQKSINQKQEWPVVAMFIDGSELNEQSL